MKERISINLFVAEKKFPLTIDREQEETLRKASKLLDDKLKQFRSEQKYAQIDTERIIIGASLSIISELLNELKIEGQDSVERELEDIKMMLEDSIRENI